MQTSSEAHQGPPPPSGQWEYLRTRGSVVKAAQGRLESVEQLALASENGWRTPWVLPPIGKRWREPISARLMLAFLGWLLEGSVRPHWGKGNLIVVDAHPRTLIGSIEDREPSAQPGQRGASSPGAWPRLLRCSISQARRCIHLAERLGLVEQIRNRNPRRGRFETEQAAAYLPTEKLLAWLRDRRPGADLFDVPETVKMTDQQKSSPTSDGSEDLLRPEGLHEVGHRAPDAVAAVDACSDASPPTPSAPPAKPTLKLVGTVPGASAAAPEGEKRAATPLRLVAAGLSARPAAPPADLPPGGGVAAEELDSFAREMVKRLQRVPPLPPLPSEDPIHARRVELEAKVRARELDARGEGDPPGGAAC